MFSAIRPTAESLAIIKANANKMASINKELVDIFLNMHAIFEKIENQRKMQRETAAAPKPSKTADIEEDEADIAPVALSPSNDEEDEAVLAPVAELTGHGEGASNQGAMLKNGEEGETRALL